MENVNEENRERVRRSKKPKMTRKEKYLYKKNNKRKIIYTMMVVIILSFIFGYMIAWFYKW